ncbi:hypothetical protein [Pseudomonas sp. 18175]|uniref:hypothetical protein n=1 Tax=Pseudomonas sp. 18175 TaxID=3390056 RepID=UPI003D225734
MKQASQVLSTFLLTVITAGKAAQYQAPRAFNRIPTKQTDIAYRYGSRAVFEKP